MKKLSLIKTILLFLTAIAVPSGCKDKAKDEKHIIVEKPQPKAIPGIQTIDCDTLRQNTVSWLGNEYTIVIRTHKDVSLPLATDEEGLSYYDQVVSLKIMRSDGSEAISRTFHKTDFQSYYQGSKYAEKGALLGFVFQKAEGSALVFGASVGSPDSSSDMYIPFVVKIDNNGGMSITKDTSLGDSGDEYEDEDEGV